MSVEGGDRKLKLYKAVVWEEDPQIPGRRWTVWAADVDEAAKLLEEEFGAGRVYTLWNEEDANRIR